MKSFRAFCLTLSVVLLFSTAAQSSSEATTGVHIAVSDQSVGMGRTVSMTATVETQPATDLAGYRVSPYVNGKRWGAEEITGKDGRAVILLPLPNPGKAEIEVTVSEPLPELTAKWIWSKELLDAQTVYFLRPFPVAGEVRSATLRVTCDDAFQAFLNGQKVASGSGLQTVQLARDFTKVLRQGENQLCVEGMNASGPAGLVLELEVITGNGTMKLSSDASWRVSSTKPAN